ncbi:MAG: hypothetical protein PHU03_07390 [Syntrophales bacterium]|nr:hypothetical protein [Syntrophales bacterium]
MKAGLIFTGSGPILIVTSYESFTDPSFIEKLNAKGIRKFISYEIPVELARQKYGERFKVVMEDLYQTDDLRVLDYNGHNIFAIFSFIEMGEPIMYEP